MDTLFINGSQQETSIKVSGFYTYCLRNGSVQGNGNISLEDSEVLNNKALKLRDEYTEFIYSLNRLFLEAKLVYKKSMSLFFFTDLSNKRTEIFDTFSSICHINIIINLINKYEIKNIILDRCDDAFESALRSKIGSLNIVSNGTIMHKRYGIYELLKQFKFILKSIIKRILLGFYSKNEPRSRNITNLFFSIFPLLLNNDFVDEKYKSFVKKGDIFLASVLTDGMHQNQSIITYKNEVKILSLMGEHILLDRYIQLRDFVRVNYYLISLTIKKKRILKKQYLFQGIDISKFIRFEIEQSFIRLPRQILYHYPLKRIFNKFCIKQFNYYLHEYSFGRFFTYVLKSEFPDIKTVGFQHGPAAERRLLYMLAKGEACSETNDWLRELPIPDSVIAEDDLSKEIYIQQGYNNVVVMETIYRFDYLKSIVRNVNKDLILIVPGLHDGLNILQKIYKEIKSNNDKTYLLKPHPRSSVFKKGIPESVHLPNLKLVNKHISTYLEIVSEVIVTYSSVGYEACQLGIPVRMFCLPGRISESPLLDLNQNENQKIKIIFC